MANDEKQPRANLANNSLIVAVLVAVSTYFIVREAPLQPERPPLTEPQLLEKVGKQRIEARLWQDPFAAVAKSIGKPDGSNGEKPCQSDSPLKSASANEQTDDKTLVIVVTVSGSPYSESAEFRRRTRYAVLAGLDRAGFEPKDAGHIGCFIPKPSEDKDLPLPKVIPFEWFRNSNSSQQQALVLWFNENVLSDEPLAQLSRLVERLGDRDPAKVKIRILGPETSDILLSMAKEAKRAIELKPAIDYSGCPWETEKSNIKEKWKNLTEVYFYTYGATVDDEALFKRLIAEDKGLVDDNDLWRLGLSKGCEESIISYFKKRDIILYRTVATDNVLAQGLAHELTAHRGVDVTKDKIALISEWDTFYGKRLPEAMKCWLAQGAGCNRSGEDLPPTWVELRYLRGLDGALPLPEVIEGQKTGEDTQATEEQGGSVQEKNKDTDKAKAFDRPFGQAQQDYLRRIAKHLRKIDDDLRRNNKGGVKAIGVLGSDVFDKLLVLRALRPSFPQALFFTTDYDETLMMSRELGWTRNLIIASSFGPELRRELQCSIPPFRSSYQTAAFLATRLAIIGDPKDADQPKVDPSKWLQAARIFEIERTGDALPFPRESPQYNEKTGQSPEYNDETQYVCIKDVAPDEKTQTPIDTSAQGGDQKHNTCEYLASCDNIQPPDEKIFPRYGSTAMRWLSGASFALAVLLALTLLISPARKVAGIEAGLISLVLFLVAIACLRWENLASWLTSDGTSDGTGEPIAWSRGVSIWPTVFLRALGIVLSFYFIWVAYGKLRTNLDETAKKMGLPLPDSGSPTDSDVPPNMRKPRLKSAWSEYVYREQLLPRICWGAVYIVAMGLLLRVAAVIFGIPSVPARSPLARDFYGSTTLIELLLMQVLIFIIFHATLSCLVFLNRLRHGLVQWPSDTREIFKARLGLRDDLVDEWINLVFVAKRSSCIITLIYYPFLLIALIIVTRSNVFANYAPSPAILFIQGLSLLIVLGSALLLRHAAEAARDTTKRHLAEGVIKAKGSDDGGRRAGQLETLLSRIDDLREGAFSPLSQQPVVRALLLPIGTFAWMKLLEYGMLPGL